MNRKKAATERLLKDWHKRVDELKKTRSYSKKSPSRKKTTATTGGGAAYRVQKGKAARLRKIEKEMKKGRK